LDNIPLAGKMFRCEHFLIPKLAPGQIMLKAAVDCQYQLCARRDEAATVRREPAGMLILDANGRYAQVFTRAGRPKFKANNRMQGTPDEIKAVWEGGVAHFGTWW
jgi:hypothetical protein